MRSSLCPVMTMTGSRCGDFLIASKVSSPELSGRPRSVRMMSNSFSRSDVTSHRSLDLPQSLQSERCSLPPAHSPSRSRSLRLSSRTRTRMSGVSLFSRNSSCALVPLAMPDGRQSFLPRAAAGKVVRRQSAPEVFRSDGRGVFGTSGDHSPFVAANSGPRDGNCSRAAG